MKIAMPVDDKSTDTAVCASFGRALYFLLYDTESKEINFMDNSAAASQGGAGIKAAQLIADSGAGVLIAPRCGENAAKVLNSAKIKIYKAVSGSVRDNLEAFKEEKLNVLDNIHPGFHGQGGK